MKRVTFLAFAVIALYALPALALGYNYVSTADFKKWLETGKQVKILDIQVPAEFQQHHFKGSIQSNAFPVKSAEEKLKLDKVLPQLDGEDEIVVVCPRGGGGAKNTYDYLKSKGIAEKRLVILEGGMQGWPYQELAVSGSK